MLSPLSAVAGVALSEVIATEGNKESGEEESSMDGWCLLAGGSLLLHALAAVLLRRRSRSRPQDRSCMHSEVKRRCGTPG